MGERAICEAPSPPHTHTTTHAAVRAICEALEVNASLLELDVSRCEVQDTAAPFIIAAIEVGLGIFTHLSFSMNFHRIYRQILLVIAKLCIQLPNFLNSADEF